MKNDIYYRIDDNLIFIPWDKIDKWKKEQQEKPKFVPFIKESSIPKRVKINGLGTYSTHKPVRLKKESQHE